MGWLDKYEKAQNGKTFLQPTSSKLPEGIIPWERPSTERAASIGGEGGEPAYLIPTFKYGRPLSDPMEEYRRTGEHLGGPFKNWQEAEKWEHTVRHPAVERGENIMGPLPFRNGGSFDGLTNKGFNYNGAWGGQFQDGGKVDMYGNPMIADVVRDKNVQRSHYDPRRNRMMLGSDYDRRDPASQLRTIAHENYHAKQFKEGRSNFDIANETPDALWARMQKRPEMMSTSEVWSDFHNRKRTEMDLDVNDLAERIPEHKLFADAFYDLGYNKVIDNAQYRNPYSMEGEAQFYEEVGREFQSGGNLPGSVGFTYARTGAPSNGKFAKKTMASAQDGKKLSPALKKLIATKNPYKIDPLDTVAKEAQSENLRRYTNTREYQEAKKQEKRQILQDRKTRIAESNKSPLNKGLGVLNPENWSREELAKASGAIGDKFRFFPEETDSFIDEYLNPMVGIGGMASDLGSAPLRAKQEDSMLPYATSIGVPIVAGRLEAIGTGGSNAKFANNLLNPLNIVPGYSSLENKALSRLGNIKTGIAPELRAGLNTQSVLGNIAPNLTQTAKNLAANYKPIIQDLKANYKLTRENLDKINRKYSNPNYGKRIHEFSEQNLHPLADQVTDMESLKKFYMDLNDKMGVTSNTPGSEMARNIVSETLNRTNKFSNAYFEPNLSPQEYQDAAREFLQSFPNPKELNKMGKAHSKVLKRKELFGEDPKGAIKSFFKESSSPRIETPDLTEAETSTIGSIRELGKYKSLADYDRQDLLTHKDAMSKVRNLVENLDDDVVERTLGIPKSEIIQKYDQIKDASSIVKKPSVEPMQLSTTAQLPNTRDKVLMEDWERQYQRPGPSSALERLGESLHEKVIQGYRTSDVPYDEKQGLIDLAKTNYDIDPNTKQLIERGNTKKLLINAIKKVEGAPSGTHFIGSSSLSSDSYPLTLEAGLASLKRGKVDINLSKGTQPYNLMGHISSFPELSIKEINSKLRELEKHSGKKLPRATVNDRGGLDLPNVFFTRKKHGGVIDDDMGQWAHPGEITRINSNDITMEGVPYDVLGISDTGDKKLMKPGKNYKFKGNKVTEFPMAKNGSELTKLDQLTNFTNYNKPTKGGWLDKYNT